MPKHTITDLHQMQSLPLSAKIQMTQRRIEEWVDRFGEDGVYVSFSGGKDSTVLLDIARKMYPDLKAMFVDVPTQYVELREFVKSFDNVDIVKPKISFMEVCEKYGFPLISKEVSECVSHSKKFLRGGCYASFYRKLTGTGEYADGQEKNRYTCKKYEFMLDAPFDVSNKCCNVMKKEPAHRYEKETGRKAILGQMADESRLRTQQWLKNGCNGFDMKEPTSNPMSFWMEQDVLLYIYENKLPICSVYGDVVVDISARKQCENQMSLSDYGIFDMERQLLKTTGCNRTGCVMCGFGCHLEKPDDARFVKLKETHPGMYKLLDIIKNNGITYRQAIDWINEHGNMNIKY